jgi:hypothetical protein
MKVISGQPMVDFPRIHLVGGAEHILSISWIGQWFIMERFLLTA